jgi:hypothetical protein
MMAQFDAIGETNAREATNHIPKVWKTTTSWFVARNISRLLMNGPSYCVVRRNKRDYKKVSLFEPVLKIWTGPSSLTGESCAVYEGWHMPGAVLRYVSIGRKTMDQARATGTLPDVTLITRYISQEYYEPLTKCYESLDKVLTSAGLMQPVTAPDKPWRLFSLFRATERGSIELNWNGLTETHVLEELMQNIATTIKVTIHQHKQQSPNLIERMEFVYDHALLRVPELLDSEYNTTDSDTTK